MAGRNVLLVEGSDDEHVVKHLCGHHGLPQLEFATLGGIERLIESFPIRLKESDVGALGVLVDADIDLQARWRALRDPLVNLGYSKIPKSPKPTGTIWQAPTDTMLPRVGIWLMPDNKANGILEDFLRFLVPTESALFAHVERSIAEIPAGERRFSDLARPKAVVHTWLAWQVAPGKPLGTAITAKYLDASVPQVAGFVDWLRLLFFT